MNNTEQSSAENTNNSSSFTATATPAIRKTLDDMLRVILLQIKDRRITVFEPIFQQEIGYRYTNLEGYDYVDLPEQIEVLKQLQDEGFLMSELLESILQCPRCLATAFATQHSCMVCKSTNVTKGAVTEHLTCGNIDFDSRYATEQEGNILVCPKCRKRLNAIGVDYARPGVFFKCLNCKALMPQTENLYTCFNCCKSWKVGELRGLQLMKYVVDMDKVSGYFLENNLLPLVAEALWTKHGLKAESPGKVKGLSKLEHSFELLISHYDSGEPMLVVDLLIDGKDDEITSSRQRLQSIRILAFYAKCLDASYSATRIIKKILVVQSELSKEARELASAYGITIVQQAGLENMVSLILKMLASSGSRQA